MRRLFAAGMAFAWLSGLALTLGARDVAQEAQFQPVKALSVTDVPSQPLSFANGAVVLDVLVAETGEVKNIEVRRDLPPLTEVAVASVRAWKFKPAKIKGKYVLSRITVAVNFNPPSLLAANVPLSPLIPQDDEARIKSSFQPPEVTFAAMPGYPFDAAGPGTVVVAVTVDEAGKVQSTKVLRDAPPFTAKALRAAVDWRFNPATLNGRPLKCTAILVFVFSQPYVPLPNQ